MCVVERQSQMNAIRKAFQSTCPIYLFLLGIYQQVLLEQIDINVITKEKIVVGKELKMQDQICSKRYSKYATFLDQNKKNT